MINEASECDYQVNHRSTRGIVMVMIGLSLAAFVGALMKMLGSQISPIQIAWFRFTGMTIILLPYLIWRYGVARLKPERPLIQMLRGLTMAGGTVAFVTGAQTVDFADAIAILYAYPFLLVVIAVVFLGETAHWSIWIGVLTGFIGVLLIMRPEFGEINTGTIYIFSCAIIVSIQLSLNRILGTVSNPLLTACMGAAFASLLLTILVPDTWQPIPHDAWFFIVLLVLVGAINQTLLVYAFTYANASTLAPFTYFEIVSAVIFGYLFFDTLPTILSWVGILLIVSGGMYVAHALHKNSITRRGTKF